MADKNDALKLYRQKRDFSITPEPAEGGKANEQARAFVIQKHWATRLHYDFRLELGGTMKSWAVPKGPSFDPTDKRMAVQTEDHPISYNRFEGEIPKGQYGGGKVIVWDKGVWIPLEDPYKGYEDGKLKFELRGHKLHGKWTLVRMKGRGDERQKPWLLIKERDEHVRLAGEYSVIDALPDSVKKLADVPPHTVRAEPDEASGKNGPSPSSGRTESSPPSGARKAALPRELEPELATLVEEPPEDPQNWLYEIKFDGYRLLTRVEKGKARCVTRKGNDWTHRLAGLVKAIEAMELPDGWYDGEIVMPGEHGLSDFQGLQNAFDSERTANLAYYVFDLPYCAGQDLREVPLEGRRAVLQRVLERKPSDKVRFSAVFDAKPQDVVASACKLGLEGVIAKRRDSTYVNRRSTDWIKLKCSRRQEFVIGGYTDPQGSRTGFGSLLLGVHDEKGVLQYAGNVGTGFNEKSLAELLQRMKPLRTEKKPFAGATGIDRKAHWLEPKLMAEVSFGEWTREGRVRHSVFRGLRDDKKPDAITVEKPAKVKKKSRVEMEPAPGSDPGAQGRNDKTKVIAGSTRNLEVLPGLPSDLRVSNPDRVIDAASGTTKIDLVRYYALVGELMMEHLKGRPVSLVRAPTGVGGELFFQKHGDVSKMPGVRNLPAELDRDHDPLLEIAEPRGLLSTAQMNVIELHTWNGVKTSILKPDRMTFDLDPGEGVTWKMIQEAAQIVHAFLQELGLPAFLKTSGGKGLHIVVPLKKQFDWDTVKEFSKAVVQHLADTIPDRFVAKSGGKNRVGKIFIDYLRNGFGATTVCAWSARARPGLGISVPVRWDELPGLTGGAQWTVTTAATRVDVGNQPWADYEDKRVALFGAMKRLGFGAK